MKIEDIINGIYRLDSESLNKFLSLIEEKNYAKGTLLYEQGAKASKIYFVKEGIVRAFAWQGTRQITFWFGMDGDVAFPIQSVFADECEYASMELLEDSTIYEICLEKLKMLYATDINIANWGRKYAELACITAEKQFIARQFKTSLERYRELLGTYPNILLKVPLGIIASYLGITQVNLSRIRAKI